MITKKDYNELFADILMVERKFKIDLLGGALPEIGQWSMKSVVSIAYKMREVSFGKGQV